MFGARRLVSGRARIRALGVSFQGVPVLARSASRFRVRRVSRARRLIQGVRGAASGARGVSAVLLTARGGGVAASGARGSRPSGHRVRRARHPGLAGLGHPVSGCAGRGIRFPGAQGAASEARGAASRGFRFPDSGFRILPRSAAVSGGAGLRKPEIGAVRGLLNEKHPGIGRISGFRTLDGGETSGFRTLDGGETSGFRTLGPPRGPPTAASRHLCPGRAVGADTRDGSLSRHRADRGS